MPKLRPTALGAKALAFVVLVWVAFFAAPYTNLYFLWLCFFGTLAAVALLAGLRSLLGLRAELLLPGHAVANTPVDLTIVIDAGTRARHGLVVTVWFGKERIEIGRIPLAVGSGSYALKMPPRLRGIHAITKATVSTAAPLGLVRASVRAAVPTELVVQPHPLAPERLPHLAAMGKDREAEVAGFREYRLGDDLREVHGRASARRASPVVREREPRGLEGAVLSLDRRTSAAALEAGLEIVAGFAEQSARRGATLRLVTNDLDRTYAKRPGGGARPLGELARWLAAASPLPPEASAPPPARESLPVADLLRGAAPRPAPAAYVPPPAATRYSLPALLALVLVDLGFVAITGAVALPWVGLLVAITLATPWLVRWRDRMAWRVAWNLSVLLLFAGLMRDVVTSSVLSLLEDGLVLAAFCQVHLVNNLHRDQKPDLLILNSAMIGVVTAFFSQDLAYSPLYAGYVLAMARVLGPGPGSFLRGLLVLVASALAFVLVPRDFERAGFALDALRNLQSRAMTGDGPQDKIPLVRDLRALPSDALVMRGRVVSGVAPHEPIHLRGGTYTLLEPDGWQPTRGRQRGANPTSNDGWLARSTREWIRLEGDSGTVLRFQQTRRDVTRLPAPLDAVRVRVLDGDPPITSSILADGALRCMPGPGSEVFAWEVELATERPPLSGKVRAKVPNDLLPYTWLPTSAMTRSAEELHARYASRVRVGADQHELVETFRASLSAERHYALPGEPGFAERLEGFLAGKGSGHCEHFAGALAILLRMARVPCRLASGWLVHEWNDARTELVVREKHAHAWVEVRDPDGGWYVVDATPARTGPEGPGVDSLAELAQRARSLWSLVTGFTSDSRTALFQRIVSWPTLVAVAGLVIAIHFARKRRRGSEAIVVRAWRRALGRAGLVLRPGETPRELVERARGAGLPPDRLRALVEATEAHEHSRYASDASR